VHFLDTARSSLPKIAGAVDITRGELRRLSERLDALESRLNEAP
jgi:hypothetical protein